MRYKRRRTTLNATHESTSLNYGSSHLMPWLWPWLLPLALLPLSGVLWLMWGDPPSLWGGAGITVLTIAASGLAWKAGGARGPLIQGLAVLTVLLCGGWLLLAVSTGLIAWPAGQWWPAVVHPAVDLWIMLAFTIGLGWTILRGLRSQGDHDNGWSALAARVGLEGSRIVRRRGPDGAMTDVIEVAPGTPIADVHKARPAIASMLDVPVEQVRTTALDEGGRRARLDLVTTDALRVPLPWVRPSAAGKSIAEPLLLGGRRTGSPLKLWISGDQRQDRAGTHVLITGMTRAGKSTGGRVLLTEVLSRVDVRVVLIDTFKGAQFVHAFRGHPHIESIITEPNEAKAYVTSLDDLIRQRTEALGVGGWEQWTPGCTWMDGTPMDLHLVHIEEVQHTVGRMRALARAAQGGISAGVHLVLSLQRAVDDNLLTDVRQQMAAVWAFGSKRGDEKYSGLSSEILEMGAAPQQWEAHHPGYSYLTAPGVPLEVALEPARSFKITPADIPAGLGFSNPKPGELQFKAQAPTQTAPAQRNGRDLVAERLDELVAAGRAEVRPADFADIKDAGGHTPSWLTRELAVLAAVRRVRPMGGGRYEVLR